MEQIEHSRTIEAPLELVATALTTREGLAAWWTADLIVANRVGDVSTFRFRSGSFNRMRIESLEPNRIRWTCVDGAKEWVGTGVEFLLAIDGAATRMDFRHHGWRQHTEYMDQCAAHWGGYMDSLESLCETGVGRPDRPNLQESG